MLELILTVGLPASGKTTYAREQEDKYGYKRVNRDDIRREYYPDLDEPLGYKFNPRNEKHVTEVAHARIIALFKGGYNVICDDTNLNPKTIKSFQKLVNEYNKDARSREQELKREVEDPSTVPEAEQAKIRIVDHFLELPLKELEKRNYKRPQSVPNEVLLSMWDTAMVPRLKVDNDASLPRCVIIDVDGTLADMAGHRGPFDFDKVHLDEPKHFAIDLVNGLPDDITRFVFSGRDDSCIEQTRQWLKDHNIKVDHLHQRETGDQRADSLIKRELYDKHIAGNFYVYGVVDDRLQMVRMWTDMGFNVVRVDGTYKTF